MVTASPSSSSPASNDIGRENDMGNYDFNGTIKWATQRREYERGRAIDYLKRDEYDMAAMAVTEAAKYDGIIKEMQFAVEALACEKGVC